MNGLTSPVKHNNTSGDVNDFKASVMYLAEKAILSAGPSTGSVGIISSTALPISVEEEEISTTWSSLILNLTTLYWFSLSFVLNKLTRSIAANNSSLLKRTLTGNCSGINLEVSGYDPSSNLLWNKMFLNLNTILILLK